MIVIYPMIVSQAVSENAIPAIAKTAELYLVSNKVHDIINDVEVKRFNKINKISMKIVGKKIVAKESVDLTEDFGEDMIKTGTGTKTKTDPVKDFEDRMERQRKKEKEEEEREIKRAKADREKEKHDRESELSKEKEEIEKEKQEREKEKQEYEKEKQEIEREKQAATKASATVKMTDFKTISLEPTFIPVENIDKFGNVTRSMIGIKVLPLRVKSEAKLSALLFNDMKLNMINGMIVSFGRNALRFIYKFIDKWTFRFGNKVLSGDPRRDILMGSHDGKGFVVFSKIEDIDDSFLRNYSKINRLFKLGWGNIIIADEVNRSAYFCMAEYKGVCNALSYSMMYQNLGQLKVYETLEDAKRQSSSLFKIKKNFSKIIGESIVDQKLIKYNSVSEDK